MTERDPLAQAEAAVRDAQTDTVAVQLALAAVELAKAATAQQQAAPAPTCQHERKPGKSAGEWLAIGCGVCVAGIGIAFASIALAIAACCATGCFLILRRIWQDMQRGR
ncbi:hypothetical protein AB0E04_03760 [Streptomyces sp. NPDC048251]|uniref:hypothetical protein n=1 Tax=Streptomyces sp. NPDC048251 TaxID=3154501 RepID=UPI0034149C06